MLLYKFGKSGNLKLTGHVVKMVRDMKTDSTIKNERTTIQLKHSRDNSHTRFNNFSTQSTKQ